MSNQNRWIEPASSRDDLVDTIEREPATHPVSDDRLPYAQRACHCALSAEPSGNRLPSFGSNIHVNPTSIKLLDGGLTHILVGGQQDFVDTMPDVAPKKGSKRKTGDRPAWARRLAQARHQQQISQAILGERVDKTQSNIGAYETGDSEPNLAAIQKLAKALGVSPAWLAFGDNGIAADATAGGIGGPSEDDTAAIAFFRAHKDDRLFARAMIEIGRMLAEEGFYPDLTSLIRFANGVSQKAQCLTDQVEIWEALRRVISEERTELRKKLDSLI